MMFVLDLTLAFLLDALFGDPPALPHPVRFLGWFISRMERFLRKRFRLSAQTVQAERRNARIAGGLLLAATLLVAFSGSWVLQYLAARLHPVAGHAVTILLLYSALATRCLGDEAMKVFRILSSGDLPGARKQLSMLVGRQTDQLDAAAVARGAAETVAENTVDGVLSVLFFACIGSFFGLAAPFAWSFKAVSTLDSMVGYKNERYLHFGTASARADDAANWLPARISALLIPAAAFFCGLDAGNSLRILRRDHGKHASPNSGWPESGFAGALRVQFGGPNVYFGQLVDKPHIGDHQKEITPETVPAAVRLMWATTLLGLLLFSLLSLASSVLI